MSLGSRDSIGYLLQCLRGVGACTWQMCNRYVLPHKTVFGLDIKPAAVENTRGYFLGPQLLGQS